jgi:hypothetical protein
MTEGRNSSPASDCVESGWRKSSRSADSGDPDCVEVANLTGAVGTRDSAESRWKKSSRSADSGQVDCVEVAGLRGVVGVRDSKDPAGAALTLSSARFREVLGAIKRGELDLV